MELSELKVELNLMLRLYDQMQIDELIYKRRSINAVNELENILKKMKYCERCNCHFLPEATRRVCDDCKYGDNTYSNLE